MTLSVVYAPLRSNLVNLPHSVASSIFNVNIPAQNVIIELEYKDVKRSLTGSLRNGSRKSSYLGWTGLYSKEENTIEVDPVVAQNIGILNGHEVKAHIKTSAPIAHTVHLEPLTIEDWSIVESNAAFLENHLINQLRSVSINQIITVFPSLSFMANLKITKIEPNTDSFAFLGATSEVIVAPIIRKTNANEEYNDKANANSKPSGSLSSKPTRIMTRCSANLSVHEVLRSRQLELRGDLPLENGSLVSVSLALPPLLQEQSGKNEFTREKNIIAKYIYDSTFSKCAGITYGLMVAFGLNEETNIGAKIIVETATESITENLTHSLPRMTLRPFVFFTSLKTINNKPVFLSTEQLQKLELPYACKGLVLPPVNNDFLPNGGILESESSDLVWGTLKNVAYGAELPLAESQKILSLPEMVTKNSVKRPLVGRGEICDNIMTELENGIGILLHGSRGCGKTVLINEILMRLTNKNKRFICFKCSIYTDKALSTIRGALKRIALEAVWNAPTVVVFDDLDKMIPAQQENNGDSDRLKRLADVFCDIWTPLMNMNQVALLCTAQSQTSIHSNILSSHTLESSIKLKSPDKTLREMILEEAFKCSKLIKDKDLDVLEFIHETEGYQPGDIWTLVDRIAATISVDDVSDGIVSNSLAQSVLRDYTPVSLRGVKLEKPSTKWDDIGGMEEVKRVILETLEWPTKYAPIFANCPLRLRSGLLLYGYPGCGKTMLAGSIASRTGLNFISVKGPEILNKYIGASEQSVRDLFDRAQAAKPCILFFDEFDSIAPKRGHDSTGVTDRVVNQLLTQMDGAEGLDGVYVLAATSRPDMIDSALLRPGRLDKTILCDIPSLQERRDILSCAAKTMDLSDEIELLEIAEKTEGFTGADLQALVYNAYLAAVHRLLEKQVNEDNAINSISTSNDEEIFQLGANSDLTKARGYIAVLNEQAYSHDSRGSEWSINDTTPRVVVTKEDMLTSLKDSKPSISQKELMRFRGIYAEFKNDRNGEMPPGTASNKVGGRVTLK